jgi:anti-sigma B factor antagonist
MTELARVALDADQVITVTGEIDLSNAASVRDAIGEVLPDLPEVCVDLTGTEYLDSAGIAMLFLLAERLSYNRQELLLVVPPDAPIRAMIRLTKLDQVIRVTPPPTER